MDSPTSRPRKLSSATGLAVAGLVVAAAGIVIQIASGADYPTVPPGLVILLAAAGLVALATRWRWTTIVGVIVSLFLLVGGVLAPQARAQLGDPGQVGVFIGTLIQLLALVVALVAGVAASPADSRRGNGGRRHGPVGSCRSRPGRTAPRREPASPAAGTADGRGGRPVGGRGR
jgi:hypothetical protein